MPSLIDTRTYCLLLIAVMLACVPEIAYARQLDDELGRMVLGAVFSVSVLSIMAGTLRTVQRLNDASRDMTDPWWQEALKNALVGLASGWIAYLAFGYSLPTPAVVLTIAGAGYAPALLLEKLQEFWRK